MPVLELKVTGAIDLKLRNHVKVPTVRHWRIVIEDRVIELPAQHFDYSKSIRFPLGEIETHQTLDLGHIELVAVIEKGHDQHGEEKLLATLIVTAENGLFTLAKSDFDITEKVKQTTIGKGIALWTPTLSGRGVEGKLNVGLNLAT